MYRCGALVVKSSSQQLLPCLTAAAGMVKDVLYIPLMSEDERLAEISQCIDQLYFHVSKVNPRLDLQVILPRITLPPHMSPIFLPPQLHHKIEALLSPVASFKDLVKLPEYICISERSLDVSYKDIQFESIKIDNESTVLVGSPSDVSAAGPFKTYTDVALGGTFDCIHNGHRLLLAQAALIATKRVLVGIADGPLLTNKVLMELISPIDDRVSKVTSILMDLKPDIKFDVVPITDVYGPTAWDDQLTCLVVSPETAKGGDKINEERRKKGLNPLAIYNIKLVRDGDDVPSSLEDKISSSDLRKQQLGKYRQPKISHCLAHWNPSTGPYLIGLTGGSASGKSGIAKRLSNLGAYPIDCDKLGHEAYLPGTKGHADIVTEFGRDVLKENGEVNRRALGRIVFSDKSQLLKLNNIVWPEIWKLAMEKATQAYDKGYKVCILDAAVLLQAEWNKGLHEVWVSIVPHKEAVRRIMERDGMPEEAAEKRLAAQISNQNVVDHGNVVFSSQWEYEFTQKQVELAWRDLQDRLQAKAKSQ